MNNDRPRAFKAGLVPVLGFLSLTACSPKIYVIDRHTIMEEEAAGEWPEFEKELLNRSQAQGPTPFAEIADGAEKSRLYNVLNSEMVSNRKK